MRRTFHIGNPNRKTLKIGSTIPNHKDSENNTFQTNK